MNHVATTRARPLRRRGLRLLAVATAMFVGAAGVALAATALNASPSPAVIQACQLKGIGTIRVVNTASDCNTKLEIPLAWNTQGQGGAPGPKGDKGDTGVPGQAGAPGVVTLATVAGSPCEDHAGQAGTISLTTSAADDIVFPPPWRSPGDQPPVHLSALTFERYDTTYYTVIVTLDHTVTHDTSVTLTSSDMTSVAVPGTVTVPAGQSTVSYPNVTILGPAGAEITATLNGESIHATLTPN